MASIFLRRVSIGSALALGAFGGPWASGMAFANAPAQRSSSLEQLSSKLRSISNLGRISALCAPAAYSLRKVLRCSTLLTASSVRPPLPPFVCSAEWDQLVMMPDREETHADRGDQLATLASVIHERSTEAALGALIAQAEQEGLQDERDLAIVREARRSFDRMTKIPAELAEKKAKLGSSAYAAWTKARAADDFASFAPMLAECFAVAAEVAKVTRTDEAELYDVALNEYEPGMTAKRCEELFAEVQATLKPLIARVLASPHQPSSAPLSLSGGAQIPAQVALNEEIVRDLGFVHGRIDVSVHPFTTSFSPADVRITSRFGEDWYQGLAGSVHEAGHAYAPRAHRRAVCARAAAARPRAGADAFSTPARSARRPRGCAACTRPRSAARACRWTRRSRWACTSRSRFFGSGTSGSAAPSGGTRAARCARRSAARALTRSSTLRPTRSSRRSSASRRTSSPTVRRAPRARPRAGARPRPADRRARLPTPSPRRRSDARDHALRARARAAAR